MVPLDQGSPNLDAEAKKAVALDLFRRGKLSHYELSKVLGLDRLQTDAYLKRHNVVEGSLTMQDLKVVNERREPGLLGDGLIHNCIRGPAGLRLAQMRREDRRRQIQPLSKGRGSGTQVHCEHHLPPLGSARQHAGHHRDPDAPADGGDHRGPHREVTVPENPQIVSAGTTPRPLRKSPPPAESAGTMAECMSHP